MRLLSFFLAICLVICFFAFYSAADDKTDMTEIFTYIGETDVEIDGRTVFTIEDVIEFCNIKDKPITAIDKDGSTLYYNLFVSLRDNDDLFGTIRFYDSADGAKQDYKDNCIYSLYYTEPHIVFYRVNNMVIITSNRTDIDNDNAFEFAKVLANRFDLKQPKKSYSPEGTLVKRLKEPMTIEEVHSYFEKNNYKIIESNATDNGAYEELVVFDDSFSSPLYAFAFDESFISSLYDAEEFIGRELLYDDGRMVIYYHDVVLTSYDHSWEKIIMKVNE